jgi:hypothetical protein
MKILSYNIRLVRNVVILYQGKDIVFRFITEYYSSLMDFGPKVIIIGLFFVWGFWKDENFGYKFYNSSKIFFFKNWIIFFNSFKIL